MAVKQLLDGSGKERRRLNKLVRKVNSHKEEMSKLSDKQLQNKTKEFTKRWEHGEDLNHMLPEAFAVAREAAKRVLGLFPFDVQVMGSIVLHEGNIAEMKTGEGKTLTATMAVYLNALTHEGVHVITVNDYLSKRDAELMGGLYNFLGLTVGVNEGNDQNIGDKQIAFEADITYTTNSALGFDYLRDNMVKHEHEKVLRGLNFCLIDEVDSILIDSSRTPLIISGSDEKESSLMLIKTADRFVKSLKDKDIEVDEEGKTAALSDDGVARAESFFNTDNLFGNDDRQLPHYIKQALVANYAYIRDKDYVVVDDEIKLIDAFTGRISEGTRLSDGLHQALEAKEGVTINGENRTMATITYQNLFRMYKKLSGMTGTGMSEEEEFRETYNMAVVPIPTNKPIMREDYDDVIYANTKTKFAAVVKQIEDIHKTGRPILVGTASVEHSELLSKLLTAHHIRHSVLNAKNNELEADIISKAGLLNAVTVATNMAGRGTDIKLGPGVNSIGGLAVIGTERHESRRIDDQLRGRAGRQGDNGSSQFFVSLDDDLMMRFGADKTKAIAATIDDDTPLRSRMLSNAIKNAQTRVEGSSYDQRKQTLQYDDVIRLQREKIYENRDEILRTKPKDVKQLIDSMMKQGIERLVDADFEKYDKDIQAQNLVRDVQKYFLPNMTIKTKNFLASPDVTQSEVRRLLWKAYKREYKNKLNTLEGEDFTEFVKTIAIQATDESWVDHIEHIDRLKQGITLRQYAQLNPVIEFNRDAFVSFNELIGDILRKFTITFMTSKVY